MESLTKFSQTHILTYELSETMLNIKSFFINPMPLTSMMKKKLIVTAMWEQFMSGIESILLLKRASLRLHIIVKVNYV